MTGRLPEGLITVVAPEVRFPTPPRSTLDEDDQVPAEVLLRGWKTYATTNRVTLEIPAARLQNIFWRLWSNPYLLPITPSAAFQDLAYRIAQGYGRIQIPPLRPGHLAPPESAVDETSGVPSVQNRTLPTSTLPTDETDTTLSTGLSPTPSNPPQSILKKSRSASDPRRKSVTVAMPGPEDGTEQGGESLSSNSPPIPELRTGSSGSKKKSAFVATSGARNRARPSLGRRKSSQSTQPASSDKTKGPKSPIKTSPGNTAGLGARPAGATLVPPLPSARRLATFELPSASSWQSVESDASAPTAKLQDGNRWTQPSSLLIDPNFRNRFVENQRRITSATNLAAAGRLGKSGSMVRFADEVPEDLRKGKEKEAPDDRRRGEADSTSQQGDMTGRRKDSDDSQVFEDDGSEDEGELRRSKSQLSLLIESRRRQSGTRDIGSPPSAAHHVKREKNDENELIVMARSEGVTKAGGVAPGRSRQRMSGTSEHRYRSPTPPPLYG